MNEEDVKMETAAEDVAIEAAAEEVAEDVVTEAAPEEAAEEAAEAAPKRKKKWPIVVGVVVAVLIAAGAGFWVWHEQPSFCNAICHTPMDPYNATFDQALDSEGVDKWGNTVENTSSMLCVTHAAEGLACLDCHVPTLGEQISEGMNWISGNYVYPLEERDLEELVEARGIKDSDEFCLNEACHSQTREDLAAATADMKRNPHVGQHGKVACSECHKAHRSSVMYCSQCHSDSDLPEGWLTSAEAKKLQP